MANAFFIGINLVLLTVFMPVKEAFVFCQSSRMF